MKDLQFASNKEITDELKVKAKRKRIKKQIDKIIMDNCKGCWYGVEIQRLLHIL